MHELPKGFSSRGADMGRAAKPGPADLPYKFSLQRLRIDAGGYAGRGVLGTRRAAVLGV